MNIAWCFHGQPRDIEKGYSTIKSFVDKHQSVHFDFFCHTWFSSDPTHKYKVSSYRNLEPIPQRADIIATIDKLYSPIEHCVEEPIDFDLSDILYSKAVLNTHNINIQNIKNTRSNIYSQTKVRDILYNHVKNKGMHYDLVISSRYDLHVNIQFDLNIIDLSKIYGANMHSPRKLLVDHLYIMPMSIFFHACSIYSILNIIINSSEVEESLELSGERFVFVPESLMTASLHYFNFIDLLVLSPHIPNFH
jgi:hypothetical protein